MFNQLTLEKVKTVLLDYVSEDFQPNKESWAPELKGLIEKSN